MRCRRPIKQKGFSLVIVLLVALMLGVIGFGGWYVWQKNHQQNSESRQGDTTTQNMGRQSSDMQRPPDPTEGGKYLVIKEWGVRFLLPDGLKGDVIYSLGSPVIDPDNNKIQSAKLLLKNESTAGDVCAVTETAQGTFIETAAQVLRVDKDKPFDAERYKGTFKHSVLTEDAYNYHLNYIIPDCAGSSTTAKIEWLQSSLESLQKVGS